MSIAQLGGQWGKQIAATNNPQATETAFIQSPGSGSENFESLTKYIPTETVTLFVAAISTIQALESLAKIQPDPSRLDWRMLIAYGGLAIATPIFIWLAGYASYKSANPGTANLKSFRPPAFRMVAGLVAFSVWAIGVPGFIASPVWQIIAGLGALLVSTLFSMLQPIFE